MSKQDSRDPFDKYFGILKLDRSADEILTELRGAGPLKQRSRSKRTRHPTS
jgi:hypothetical protein